MLTKLRARAGWLGLALILFVVIAACGGGANNGDSTFVPPGPDSGPADGSMSGDSGQSSGGGGDSGSLIGKHDGGATGTVDAAAGFDVLPSTLQTLTVTLGQAIPTLQYKAYENGQPVSAGWSVDRGDLAAITQGASDVGTFTPTGAGGGLVTVTAGRNGATLARQIFLKIVATQNGANAAAPGEGAQIAPTNSDAGVNAAGVPVVLTQGGGIGGVGGDGLGDSVDGGTASAFGNPMPASAMGLTFLYPYDGTVWPRGLLAPLLQWSWTPGDADAIQIKLATTSGSLTWTGTFGRPAILAQVPSGKYVDAPIPQDVWDMATNTAGGPVPGGGTDQLGVSLLVEKGGVAYGPITETWTIAPGLLDGIIYYNSYGTQLVSNYTGAVGAPNGEFGGAVLSIHVGDTGPKVAAGTNGGAAQCRVCHSVAAQGARLVVQQGSPSNYPYSSAYDLSPSGNVEHPMTHDAEFPGVYPDGTMALTSGGELLPLPVDTIPIPTSGLSSFSSELGSPAFSPDGKLVVVNPMSGSTTVGTPTQQLWVLNFAQENDGGAGDGGLLGVFSNPVLVVDDTGQPAGPFNGQPVDYTQPGWGAFLPDGKSLVFQHQSVVGIDGVGGDLYTRKGAKSKIDWTSSSDKTHVTVLNALNGLDATGLAYLPKLAASSGVTCTADGHEVDPYNPLHDDDADMNYEPTVNPVPAGGYVWVVFTSRRMYGNVATIPPYCSDPRGVNLITNITTKKLWVAAIDLNKAPGTDASHPAFYLPAQELLAGNSRGFWVQAPCLADGASCMTGDQCCNGYCEEGTNDAGQAGLVCGNKPPNATCSPQGDKCTSNADCCLSNDICIDGFCEQSSAQ